MNNWFEKTILDGIKELDEEKSCTGWFSINAISNIPYIKYPFLPDEQNEEKNNNNTEEIQLLKNNTLNSKRIIIRGNDYER